jgi:hypothetical protein
MGIFTEDGKLQTGWASKSDGLDMNEQRRLLAIELGKIEERKEDVKLCNPVQDLTEDIFERLEDEDLTPPTDILVQAENGTYQALLIGKRVGSTFHIDYLCSTVKGGGVALINKVKQRFSKIDLEPVSTSLAGYYESLNFNYKNRKESDTMVWISQKGARRTRRKKLRKTRRKHKQ